MKYNEKEKSLSVSVRELVALARRGTSDSVPLEEDEPALTPQDRYTRERYLNTSAPPIPLVLPTELSGYPLTVYASADKIEGEVLHYLCLTDRSPSHPDKEWTAQMRAEGYIGAYAFALAEGLSLVSMVFHYVNPTTDEEISIDEHVKLARLSSFFEKCKGRLATYAEPAIHRATVRLPSMAKARFPYGEVRAGQDELIHSVYRTISHGGTLIAEAPTGIGKTVSVLYPAIRAMGKGKCEKIFYLTPKTTTAEAAIDCIRTLADHGVCLRAIALSAKERLCPLNTVCRQSKALCPLLKNNRLAEGALALFHRELPAVTAREITEVAREFSLCPYELSLTYSELCDVVIGDFNYLFDPRVYLRRFFDGGGEYAFLVDEAHNLPDRAREMYSAELSELDLSFRAYPLHGESPLTLACASAAERFRSLLFPLVKSELRRDEENRPIGATHTTRLPEGLIPLFSTLSEAAERELMDAFRDRSEEREERIRALREYFFRISSFLDALLRFDEHYELFLFYEEDTLRIKLFSIDPGGVIGERVALGRATVFFSATLTPMNYYRSLLGAERGAETLSVPSPFDRSQLSVSIMDKISTRSSERERTLPEILRVIAATVSARRGNYIVFTPSFEYTERIAEAFSRKYPKIRTMVQGRSMSAKEKREFMDAFARADGSYLIAFCVTGGIFSEGIDLFGDRLIGTVVVGVTLPQLSFEREAMQAYFAAKYEMGKEYAYVYPGLNKVLQAAGRVIRREDDYGVIVLIDDRFADPLYKKSIPELWHGLKFVGDAKGLRMLLDRFWSSVDECREQKETE